MQYSFSPIRQKVKDIEEWLKKEFSAIRTGRATPAILDSVKVDAYGSAMPVTSLANISIEDARMLRISPWDNSLTKAIEKAIATADLGLSVALDDKGVRVMFPELTSDRRAQLIKVAKQKSEEARITLRSEREKVLKDIDHQLKESKISEDDKFRLRAELQKIMDDAGRIFDDMLAKKEKEISQ